MSILDFNIKGNINYNWCGKFESPSPDWMHLTRDLIDFELMIVTEGILYIADSVKEYTVKTGEYLIMAPDHFQHGYKKSDCAFYWLHFGVSSDSWARNNTYLDYPENLGIVQIPCHGKLPFADRIVVLLKQLQDSDRRYHNNYLNNSFTTTTLCELYNQVNQVLKKTDTDHAKQIYHDMVDYLKYHACENIRVSQVAEYFGYNEKYLSTLFHKQSGISLKQFMLQVKMDAAKAELTDTNHTISQIAYNVGFSDTHNFTNAFKKVTGLSPTAFRESYEKRALYHQ